VLRLAAIRVVHTDPVTSLDLRRARVFGNFAQDCDRWRPGYPPIAIDWLVPPNAARIADVGAGTGKLTGLLLGRGLQVVAVEPDAEMLAVLAANFPGVKAEQAGAENLPLDDASVDAVLVGQAWHWFDHELALAEAQRVVRPGGWLGLIGNTAFPRTAWQLELARLDPDSAGRTFDEEGEEWEPPGLTGCVVESDEFSWQEELTAPGLRARLATHSAYALMADDEREHSLDEAAAVLTREMTRSGSPVVLFDHVAYCARVRF